MLKASPATRMRVRSVALISSALAAQSARAAMCTMSGGSKKPLLSMIEQQPVVEQSASLIWMHGLGDSADGWASLMPQERSTTPCGSPHWNV
eukprot:6198934-Pleurochrysis_carterae.AAC.1